MVYRAIQYPMRLLLIKMAFLKSQLLDAFMTVLLSVFASNMINNTIHKPT